MRTGPKGSFVQFYEIQQCREYKEHVAEVAHHQATQTPVLELAGGGDFTLPLDKHRVVVVMRFNLTKPPSYPKRVVEHTKRPDADNLAKGVLDGLVQGRLLKDDGCVTDLTSYKRYAEPGHPPGVEIQLLAIPAEMA